MSAPTEPRGCTALVLSGGGARGAYEAGVVAGLVEVLGGGRRAPFEIFTGTSVGAINAAWLAAHADRADMNVAGLCGHWRELSLGEHLSLDPVRFLAGGRLREGLALLRGHDRERWGRSLLDPSALEALVERSLPYARLHANVDRGTVRALVVAALEVATARTTLFAELAPGASLVSSRDARRIARPTRIEARHVLASAAIPLLFPARRVGRRFYCDGGVRFNTPIAPAIRAGADRLVVVSLLHPPAESPPEDSPAARANEAAYPSPVFLLGKVLNALLLDPVRYDLQVLERLNAIVAAIEEGLDEPELARVHAVMRRTRGAPYRQLDALVFAPSADIGQLAHAHAHRVQGGGMAGRLVHQLADLGRDLEADLLSFVLFDRDFASALIDLGRRDALARRDEIEAFFGENPAALA